MFRHSREGGDDEKGDARPAVKSVFRRIAYLRGKRRERASRRGRDAKEEAEMMQMTPASGRRRRAYALRLLALLLPVAMGMGCAGNDDKDDGGGATPTSAIASTATPTTRPATATPSPSVGAATPTPTLPANVSTPTPTQPAGDIALAACQKLATCSQCFMNDRGVCVEPIQCAGRLTEDEARCISAAGGCNATTLGDCLTVGCGGDGTGECE
jgi:hypothetical protein